ncbi:MAG: PD-(D/E)XK nuclease family protein [Chloroflexi bacterium]|nr:PD-(D/E)XK nuclease family protein [Chloroflexota bacterium]
MTDRVEKTGPDERVDLVLRRLINRVRRERGFDRITVVTPTNQASFFLRRALARGGLFNVDFRRLEDVAEQIAGREFSGTALHDLQASEFVFEAARDDSLGSRLGGADVSPQLQAALHSTFRELELLSQAQLRRLAAMGSVRKELVARFEKYTEFAEQYRRGFVVAARAAEIVRQFDRRVAALGVVVLVSATPIAPVQKPLFDALADLPDSVTVSSTAPWSNRSTLLTRVGAVPQRYGSNTQLLRPISVPNVADEIRSAVREILKLARPSPAGQAIRFSQMAVVFEDDSYAARVGEALELAGIPVSGPERSALNDAPEGRFISGLLDVFENDFSRLDLTAWLSAAPVKDPSTKSSVPAARWDAVSRAAGVTSSVADSWVPRITQYAAHLVTRAMRSQRFDEGRANEVQAAESDARYALDLKKFAVSLEKRRPGVEQDSWSGFGGWLRSIVADYLVHTDSEVAESRRTRLFTLIDRLESLETRGQSTGYKHCAGVLREQLGRRSAGLRSLGSGVYVGPVWTAAGCPFDTLFVLGMSEGRYPSVRQSDPLLPDPIKKEIDSEGKFLRTVNQVVEDSHQTFSAVVSSARQVYMYWPTGIPGEAREFGPARWFLDAVRYVSDEPTLQAGQLTVRDIPGLEKLRRSDLLSLNAEQAGDPQEFDVLGARNWVASGNEPSTFPLSDHLESIAGSVRFETEQSGDVWSVFDGKISSTGTSSGNGETEGSATAFETYAACPYRYFLSRRLYVEPTESPEPEVALDALTFGTLIHDVLEQFSIWRMAGGSEEKSRTDQEGWLRDAVGREIEKLKEQTPGRSGGAWRIEESRAWLILRQWLRREPTTANQPEMRQVEAEYSFGSNSTVGRGGGRVGGPPVEVRTASGQTVRFRGQIDRVDISRDGRRVIVYDYKSGGTSAYARLDSDPIKKGTKLQLPLYSKAIAHKYPDADITASYWFVRESGSDELKPGAEKYQNERAESALVAAVGTIVEGIDNGVFPARPGDSASWGGGPLSFENCLYCEYSRVCPKNKARLWEAKKGSDPGLGDYVKLAESDP